MDFRLQKRDQELVLMKENYLKATETNDETMTAFNNFRDRFYNLEVRYDQQREELKQEIEQLRTNNEEQEKREKVKMKEVIDAKILFLICRWKYLY